MINSVILSNPLSSTYVYLKPNQGLQIILSKDVQEVKCDSDFLEMKENSIDTDAGKVHTYTFNYLPDIAHWTTISQTFLGEIKIFRQNAGCTIVGVVLDSTSKNILTVINPVTYTVKLRPTQFLEVIIIDCDANTKPEITPGSCKLEYEQIPSIGGQERNFPLPARSFLFALATDIENWPAGVYNAGWLALDDKDDRFSLLIDLKIKRKDKHTRNNKKYQDISLQSKPFTSIEEGCRWNYGNRIGKV